MTIDLNKLKALCAAATQPSPWVTFTQYGNTTVVDAHGMWVADCGAAPREAAFIAAARTAVPELIAEVARLQVRCGELENLVSGYRETYVRIADERDALIIRRDELLATIAHISQTEPLPDDHAVEHDTAAAIATWLESYYDLYPTQRKVLVENVRTGAWRTKP